LRRRALRCVGCGACAVRAVGIPPEAASAGPRRMAPRARDRPHPLPWHEPAAGGDRDDERHQRRLPDRLLCRADPLPGLGAERRASARDRYRGGLHIARRRLAFGHRRRACSPQQGRRARASRRFRLGDGHRADAGLPCPLGPAAPARVRAIHGLRRPRGAGLGGVRIGGAGRAGRRRADDPVRRNRLGRAGLYDPDLRPGAHAAGRGRAHSRAGERLRRACGRGPARRASDRCRRGRLRAHSRRRGCSGVRAANQRQGCERSGVTKAEKLSLAEARRIALAAQGFGDRRPEKVTAARWLKAIDRLSLHQIDSVNVLVRAHYLPAFSRLGPYDRSLIDDAAWGKPKKRRLFEYWAHEASLLPLSFHPLLRWRMARADRGEAGWKGLRPFAAERRAEAEGYLKRIRNEGPRAASDFEEKRGRSGWWEWGEAKRALEWLFWAGHITTATRRGAFERVYDLTERVIPAEILALPAPDERDAHRALIERAAQALGVATAQDLRDYFRLGPDDARQAIAQLLEAGVLLPVEVPGWAHLAYCHRDARSPRRVSARAV